MQPTTIHDSVREHYAELARTSNSCCGSNTGNSTLYDEKLIQSVPADVSGFSLGCGDPITLAKLQRGETVLDLGSGGGLDCFLASKQVGEAGHVIGVDMTPQWDEVRSGYFTEHMRDAAIAKANLSPTSPSPMWARARVSSRAAWSGAPDKDRHRRQPRYARGGASQPGGLQ